MLYLCFVQLFLSCLCNLQNECLLQDINTEQLFSNIPDIHRTSVLFWRQDINAMLTEARATKQPLDPSLLYNAFTNVSAVVLYNAFTNVSAVVLYNAFTNVSAVVLYNAFTFNLMFIIIY